MSGVAIPYRSDAQCVRVNKLVVCLCLSVFLLISHPPSLPLNIQNIVYLSSSLTGRPSPSRSPSLSLSSTIPLSLSLYTRLPPYFIPPILFTPPAAIQYGHGYLHIRQEE